MHILIPKTSHQKLSERIDAKIHEKINNYFPNVTKRLNIFLSLLLLMDQAPDQLIFICPVLYIAHEVFTS
jgi:hypothetical protein